jgi:hypothetical protein
VVHLQDSSLQCSRGYGVIQLSSGDVYFSKKYVSALSVYMPATKRVGVYSTQTVKSENVQGSIFADDVAL